MSWLNNLIRRLFTKPPDIPYPVPNHEVILKPDWVLGPDGVYRERPLTHLFPYQQTGVRRAIHRYEGRCLLADEQGLGKTVQALFIARTAGWFPTLVVCPASLKSNWSRETHKHIGMRSLVLESRSPPTDRHDIRTMLLGYDIFIINYDIITDWLPFIQAIQPKMLVIDECQYLGSRDTLRTKMMTQLAREIPYILALSGTPISNNPAEVWPTLHILRPDLYPTFFPFGIEYCRPVKIRGRWVYKGAKNLAQLHQELKQNVMIRRRKADVMSDLPKKSRFIVPIALTPEGRKEYNYALKDFLSWLRKVDAGKVLRASRAEGLVKSGYLKRLTARLKLPAALEWMADLLHNTNEKVISYAVHRSIVEDVKARFDKKSVLIYGGMTRQRERAEHDFKTNPDKQLLSGNLKTVGIGHNFTEASITATLELGWKPADHSQAEARIDRYGQKLPTSHYYLLAEDTIEEDICRLIQEKQGIADAAIDGLETISDMDIYDAFIKTMRKRI